MAEPRSQTLEILQMYAECHTPKVIAEMLGISIHAVHNAKKRYPDYIKRFQGKNLDGTPLLVLPKEQPETEPEALCEEPVHKHSVAELFKKIEQLQKENELLKQEAAKQDEPAMPESISPHIIAVTFKGNSCPKEYFFRSYEHVEKGQHVVVDTANGFALAIVSNENISDVETKITREVVSVINTDAFDARRSKERRIEELRQKMDERVSQLRETAVYEMLSKEDKVLFEMFSEYKSLVQ